MDDARRPQLRDDAAAHVRRLIITGALRRGDAIRLDRVAADIDVSVTPVREALLLLVQDGWVIQEPNRGFHVAPFRRGDVRDAYLVNEFVAGELAARAALRLTPAERQRLRDLDDRIRTTTLPGSPEPERLNAELHDVIYRAADSPRLRWFVMTASRLVPRQHWSEVEGWDELNRAGHAPIIAALERRDGEAARALTGAHMRDAGELLVAQLDRTGFWSDVVELAAVGDRSPVQRRAS